MYDPEGQSLGVLLPVIRDDITVNVQLINESNDVIRLVNKH